MTPIFLLWQVSGDAEPPSPELWVRSPGHGKRPRHPRYSRPKLKPEEIARQQRATQEYLDSLEPKAPAAELVRPQKAPEFTVTLARAATDVQLGRIVRIAAAVRDRDLAAEELRRRHLKLVLLLALD